MKSFNWDSRLDISDEKKLESEAQGQAITFIPTQGRDGRGDEYCFISRHCLIQCLFNKCLKSFPLHKSLGTFLHIARGLGLEIKYLPKKICTHKSREQGERKEKQFVSGIIRRDHESSLVLHQNVIQGVRSFRHFPEARDALNLKSEIEVEKVPSLHRPHRPKLRMEKLSASV